jgi:hypothetical protein
MMHALPIVLCNSFPVSGHRNHYESAAQFCTYPRPVDGVVIYSIMFWGVK